MESNQDIFDEAHIWVRNIQILGKEISRVIKGFQYLGAIIGGYSPAYPVAGVRVAQWCPPPPLS